MWLLAMILMADSARSLQVPVARAETLHVEITGPASGEPVVLVPGLLGSAFAFRKLVPLLTSTGYQAIIIEPLGIGASTHAARADYSMGAQANRVAAVLDSLDLRQTIVVGHSVGGSEGFFLAVHRPDLVRALVTLEGGPAETAATPAFRSAMRYAAWIKWLGGVRLIRRKIRSTLIASSGDASWVTDDVITGYTAAAARDLDGTLKSFIAIAAAREPEAIAPHLTAIRCPVRLVRGMASHEGDVSPEEVVLMQRTLRHFAVDSIPGAGHFSFEERPEAVLLAVQRADAQATMVETNP